jgi:hypothetical protein
MYHLECLGCGTNAYVSCPCPPEAVEAMNGAHLPICALNEPGAAVVCPPDSGCCQEDHSHDTAANACHGQHADDPCPEDAHRCGVWATAATTEHPETGEAVPPADPCPGGHCHQAIDGCTVCRSIRITATPGNVTMQRAGA